MELHGVPFDEEQIGRLCRRNGITRLSLFGSILTDRFGPDSDVDFLVEFDPVGRTADLRTAEDLSPYFRDRVVYKARPLYAA